MTELVDSSVKQCHADASLAWLRELLAGNSLARSLDDQQQNRIVNEGIGALLSAHRSNREPALTHAAQQLAMRELAHQLALQRLASACTQPALEILVIKGEALARTLHHAPAVRTRSDIDLWVQPAQLPALCSILQSLGYPEMVSIRQQWARFEVVHGQRQAPSVAFDVHVHPFFRPRLWQQRPFERVWADAIELPGFEPLRAPNANDSFAIAALHLAKNTHKRWIWLYDIDQFCRRHPDAVAEVCQRAPGWGLAALVADALSRAVSVFDTPLPCALPLACGLEPSASMLRRPGKLASLWRDLMLLSGWRARVAFVRELFEKA